MAVATDSQDETLEGKWDIQMIDYVMKESKVKVTGQTVRITGIINFSVFGQTHGPGPDIQQQDKNWKLHTVEKNFQ